MSKILYIRITDEQWAQIADEARKDNLPMVRAAIRVLDRGLICAKDHVNAQVRGISKG